jgi:hypothetical protein
MPSFFKTFLQMGIPFGLIMGVFYAFQYGLKMSLVIGAFAGFFFGLFIALVSHFQSKKFTSNRPLQEDEKLLKEGHANYQSKSGWIYLTDSRLLFVTHKLNIKNHELSIPLAEIVSVLVGKSLVFFSNRLIVNLKNGQVERFFVNDAKGWKKQFDSVI